MKHHTTSLTPRRAIVLLALHAYRQQGATLTSLEAQLICYLLQRLGLTLKLQYHATPQGPRSDQLARALMDMRPDLLQGQLELGQDRPLQPEPLAIERARVMLKEHASAQRLLHTTMELLFGMETYYGLWLLSCVDWLYHQHNITPVDDLARALSQARAQRIQAQPHHVHEAFNRLRQHKLISV